LAGDRGPAIDDLPALWEWAWSRQLEREGKIAWDTETPESLRNEGLRILQAKKVQGHLAKIKANFDPSDPRCAIEKRVQLSVPGVPIPIIGYIDNIPCDGVPEDIKTAARMWSQAKADAELQPLFYLAALNQAGIEVPNWEFRFHVFTKGKDPYGKTLSVHHSPVQFFFLFEMIQSVYEAISKGTFPMNCSIWKCSPQYCEYWPLCRGKYT